MKIYSSQGLVPDPKQTERWFLLVLIFLFLFFLNISLNSVVHAASIPGSDRSQDLTAMGDLMKTLATIIVDWVCPLIAVLASLSGGAHVLRQNWAMAGSCFLGAAIFAIPVAIVRGFFTMGGGQSLFG